MVNFVEAVQTLMAVPNMFQTTKTNAELLTECKQTRDRLVQAHAAALEDLQKAEEKGSELEAEYEHLRRALASKKQEWEDHTGCCIIPDDDDGDDDDDDDDDIEDLRSELLQFVDNASLSELKRFTHHKTG